MKLFYLKLSSVLIFSSVILNAQEQEVTEKSESADYVKNHADLSNPFELLGGSVKIDIRQKSGGVHVALPDNRELDPVIFGTPDKPRNFGGTPVITGVPEGIREVKNDKYTQINKKSPFGDKHIIMKNGELMINAMDITATDAATTEDEVKLSASWQDEEGNTYEVTCCEVMAKHGVDFPTYGGVATNMVLHGFSGTGTPLMPSEFAWFAFWGMGSVSKNGEVLDKPRLIHGMLTEYVRTDNYELAFDSEVTPEKRHFHLLTVPFKPDLENFKFENNPVKTGFMLKNGMEMPFWHVMFDNLEIEGERE